MTKTRKNMKKVTLDTFDKALLRKRSLIETSIEQLKNIRHIEHGRHRRVEGFLLN